MATFAKFAQKWTEACPAFVASLGAPPKYNDLVRYLKRKSLVCDFPDCIPSNLMNHFIRGYFDGDGCIYFGKKKVKLFPVVKIVGSKRFIFKLGSLLRSKQMKLSIYKDGVIYSLQMSYSNVEKFMDFIYCDSSIWMKRKRKRWEGFMK